MFRVSLKEWELLWAIVSDRKPTPSLFSDLDWNRFFHLCEANNISLAAFQYLSKNSAELPAELKKKLIVKDMIHVKKFEAYSTYLWTFVEEIEKFGYRYMLYKGDALIFGGFLSPRLREFTDFDLLMDPEEVWGDQLKLLTLRYGNRIDVTRGIRDPTFSSILDVPFAEIYATRRTLRYSGKDYHAPSREMLYFLCALHFLSSGLKKLRWLYDLSSLIKKDDCFDFDWLAYYVERYRMEGVIWLMLLATRQLDATIPPHILEGLQPGWLKRRAVLWLYSPRMLASTGDLDRRVCLEIRRRLLYALLLFQRRTYRLALTALLPSIRRTNRIVRTCRGDNGFNVDPWID